MPTVKLIPSSYYVSSSYLSLTNEENMYSNISSTTYATLTNTNASTSYYYFYLRGFNIGDIPANAQVSSFTIRIRGRASGAYNSAMYLSHGTTTISGATATQLPNSTTVTTRTFNNSSLTWADIVGYGSDFGIRVNCRRNAKNTQSYYYIYGAEIEVTYTVEDVHPTSVSVSPTTASIEAGSTVQLTETVLPSNATDKSVSWSSSNTSVATVSSNGLVTGVSAGSAIITVTTIDGSYTATCAITVTPDKKFYFKETSTTWTGAIKVWVKTSATTWTEQTVLDDVFDSNTNYIQGN